MPKRFQRRGVPAVRKILALALICLSSINAFAQNCPFVPEILPRLPGDAQVTVRFEPGTFTHEERAALSKGLDDWRPYLPKEMTVTTTEAPREECEACVSVVRERPLTPGDNLGEAAERRFYLADKTLLYSALVRVRPDQHRPDILEALMAHEFGHLLGLGHSEKGVLDRRTIMAPIGKKGLLFLTSYRPEATGPTACDALSVAE